MRLKKFIFAVTAFIALAMSAQTELNDTVRVIENANRVRVMRQGNATTIRVVKQDDKGNLTVYNYDVKETPRDTTSSSAFDSDRWAMELPFMREKSNDDLERDTPSSRTKKAFTGLKNFYWGWTFNYDGKSGIENCFEIGVAEIIGIQWRPWQRGPKFDVGLGFGMRRYLASDGMLFSKSGDRLCSVNAPDEIVVDHARWDVFTFDVPLMITQQIYRDFGISIGALVNFNTYSRATSQWQHDGIRYRETLKGLQQRLVTVDIVGIIGLTSWIGAYAKWCPTSVMQAHNGPDFKSWAVGVALNF